MPPGWHASLSHSHGLVIAVLAPFAVGLDIEFHHPRRRTRLAGLIEALPEPTIRQAIRRADEPEAAFYRFWCLREALFKSNPSPETALFDRPLDQALRSGEFSHRCWQSTEWSLALVAPQSYEARLRGLPPPLPGLNAIDPPTPRREPARELV